MNNTRRMIISALEILIGAALLVGARVAHLDSAWLGMGGALVAVGLVQLVLGLRYRADADYREKTDTEATDERNLFIRSRAWVWAGTGFVIIGGVLTVVLMILGKHELSTVPGIAVCVLMILYWLSYFYLTRKY